MKRARMGLGSANALAKKIRASNKKYARRFRK